MALLFKINFISVLAGLCLPSLSFCFLANAGRTGTATYYSPTSNDNNCVSLGPGINMIALAGNDIWQNGAACGTYYQVDCLSHCQYYTRVWVKIVGCCSSCGSMALSDIAFNQISYTSYGSMKISYQAYGANLTGCPGNNGLFVGKDNLGSC